MGFKFPCPHCSATLNAQDQWRGKKATCNSCGKKLVIPLLATCVDADVPVASAPVESPPVDRSAGHSADDGDVAMAEIVEAAQEEIFEATCVTPTSTAKPKTVDDLFDFTSQSPRQTVVSDTARNGSVLNESRVGGLAGNNPSSAGSSSTGSSATDQVDTDRILSSIRGSIAPVETTVAYRLAVIPVSLLMIILPLIYIGLIVGVGYFTYWYAVNGLSVFEGVPSGGGRSRGAAAVLMYAGPLFASGLTCIFLVKPLFAKSIKSTAPVPLKPEQQPLLFAFVEQIAKAVHAPKPTSIVVDTEVNASASFRRGWLSLFRRGDLELTIGLPLAERLTAQELAGVIAHEFGHFSQGLGMRLQYIVRSINMWFAQVVYQRDRADEWLENSAKQVDLRLGIIIYFTMFMIWLSRRVLWVLMMIGNGFSSVLLRQMEYDADQHEIRLAGSHHFVSTAKKLPRLGVAYQEAAMQMQHSFADERLVDHLPALVGMNFDQQSPELLKEIEEDTATEKSSWFDTHPLNRDRAARAEQTASSGIMSLDIPASQLFQDYETLAKTATRQFYIEIFEGEFKDSMLTKIDQIKAWMESSKADYEARVKLLGEEFAVVRPIPLASPSNRREQSQSLLTRLAQIRRTMDEHSSEFSADCKALKELEDRWITASQAISFQSCGMTFNEKVWEGIPVDSPASTKRAADQTRIELGQLHEKLSRFERLFAERVDSVIQLLWNMKDNDQFSASEVRERMLKALNTLTSQFKCQQEYVSLKRDFSIVAGIFAAVGSGSLSKSQLDQVNKHVDQLKDLTSMICQNVETTAYPFDHSRGDITLAQYLAPQGLKLVDMTATCETSISILQNFDTAYIRSIGVLCDGILRTEEYLSKVPVESLP